MIPEMTKAGYNKRYATALVAAAGFLGVLIPPSIPGVVYAVSSGVSIAAIFVATVVPGIILASFYILVNYLIFGRKQPKQTGPFSVKALLQNVGSSGKDASWALFMPVIILGGIYGGIFTPTEAAAVSVIYGLFVGWFIYHGLNRKNILGIFRDSALTSCVLLIVLALAGSLLGRVFTVARAPDYIAELMLQMTKSPVVFLLLFNIFVLILGCFLETNTMVIILTPIFVPIAQKYGIHPIHFGAILLLNVEIGLITPPFAGNLFVACRVSNLQLDEIVRPLLPFLFVCFPTLAITTYIPWVSMWLPRLLGVG
jgi:C4-dicarboxylate transporter, DctM subunit